MLGTTLGEFSLEEFITDWGALAASRVEDEASWLYQYDDTIAWGAVRIFAECNKTSPAEELLRWLDASEIAFMNARALGGDGEVKNVVFDALLAEKTVVRQSMRL
jgi:hypothetical protein